MTSGPERSITGLSFPKWMKSKISDRAFDFEENAFSPPTGDDGFFLIRYKKPIEEVSQPKVTTAPKYTPVSHLFDVKKDVDLSKHTKQCQEYIPNAKITTREIGLRNGTPEGLLKSTGNDDGYKGDNAACGYSVVAVANQMLAERNNNKEELTIPPSQRLRRNSKSLPSSPLSSPKLLKRNPYFTSILFSSTEKVSLSGSSLRDSSTDDSSDDIPHIVRASSEDYATPTPSKVLKAKPSQLREMNFWSPTSM